MLTHSVNAATNQGFNDNPLGLVFQKHADLRVKGASHFYENTQKSNLKTEEKFKKHGFIEDSATKQHRLTHPDSLISAPLPNYHLWSLKFSYKTILILL